jgi:hypothetical protein
MTSDKFIEVVQSLYFVAVVTETENQEYMDHLRTLDDIEVVDTAGILAESVAYLRERCQLIEHELQRRMEERGAKEIHHEVWTCVLKTPTPDYDVGKLRGKLGEVIPPAVYAKGFTEAHDKTVHVEAGFDMRVVKGWASAYGDAVREIVEDAMLPKPPRVKVERRK